MWATHWKSLLRSKDFFLAFTFCTAFMVIATLGTILQKYGAYSASLAPAWYYFGYAGSAYNNILKTALGPFAIFILPFAGPVAYGWNYYAHQKSNLLPLLVARKSRSSYFLSGAATAFLAGFLVIFIPLLISELLVCLAVPLDSLKILPEWPTHDYHHIRETFGRGLAMNMPYLYYFIYTLIPAAFSGLLTVLGYGISLFFHKNRFLVVTIPGILYIAGSFLIGILSSRLGAMPYMVIMPPSGSGDIYLSDIFILFGTVLAADVILVAAKLLFKRDEL